MRLYMKLHDKPRAFAATFTVVRGAGGSRPSGRVGSGSVFVDGAGRKPSASKSSAMSSPTRAAFLVPSIAAPLDVLREIILVKTNLAIAYPHEIDPVVSGELVHTSHFHAEP